MNAQQPLPYYLNFTPIYRYRLEARLAPYYMLHFHAYPYRRDIPAIGYRRPPITWKRRRRDALYDAMFNILLRGYSELTDHKLHPASGQMLIFLSKVMKAIDDSFETRLQAGCSLDLKEMMAEAPVREKLDLWQSFLDLFGRRDGAMGHLDAVYANHFQCYAHHLGRSRNKWQFDEVLASAEFDSGILLRTMLEIVARFNGHQLAAGTLEDFYLAGIAGKFADDMVDLVRDIQRGTPNLLYALVRRNKEELAALEAGIQSRTRLNSSWWQLHCPATYREFFDCISFYISHIDAPHVKLACDLSLVPAVIGRDYDKT